MRCDLEFLIFLSSPQILDLLALEFLLIFFLLSFEFFKHSSVILHLFHNSRINSSTTLLLKAFVLFFKFTN
jgi:hypothetical protein